MLLSVSTPTIHIRAVSFCRLMVDVVASTTVDSVIKLGEFELFTSARNLFASIFDAHYLYVSHWKLLVRGNSPFLPANLAVLASLLRDERITIVATVSG